MLLRVTCMPWISWCTPISKVHRIARQSVCWSKVRCCKKHRRLQRSSIQRGRYWLDIPLLPPSQHAMPLNEVRGLRLRHLNLTPPHHAGSRRHHLLHSCHGFCPQERTCQCPKGDCPIETNQGCIGGIETGLLGGADGYPSERSVCLGGIRGGQKG